MPLPLSMLLPALGAVRSPVQAPVREPISPRSSVVLRLARRTMGDGLPIRVPDSDRETFAFVILPNLPERGDVLARPPIAAPFGRLDSVLWARSGAAYPRSYGETLRLTLVAPVGSLPPRLTVRLAFRRGTRAVVAKRIGDTAFYTPRPSEIRRGAGGFLPPLRALSSARSPRGVAPALDRSRGALLFRFGSTAIFSAALGSTAPLGNAESGGGW